MDETTRDSHEAERDASDADNEARRLEKDEIERMAREKHGDPIESARGFLLRGH